MRTRTLGAYSSWGFLFGHFLSKLLTSLVQSIIKCSEITCSRSIRVTRFQGYRLAWPGEPLTAAWRGASSKVLSLSLSIYIDRCIYIYIYIHMYYYSYYYCCLPGWLFDPEGPRQRASCLRRHSRHSSELALWHRSTRLPVTHMCCQQLPFSCQIIHSEMHWLADPAHAARISVHTVNSPWVQSATFQSRRLTSQKRRLSWAKHSIQTTTLILCCAVQITAHMLYTIRVCTVCHHVISCETWSATCT